MARTKVHAHCNSILGSGLAFAACTAQPSPAEFGDGGATTSGSTAVATSSSDSDAANEAGDQDSGGGHGADTTEGFIFDVGTFDTPAGSSCARTPCPCDAVDLLFVVDNSGSMEVYRDGVTSAFPTFVDEMFASLPPGTDLHVGLTRATGFFDPGESGVWLPPTCDGPVDGTFVTPDVANNGINGQQGRLFEHGGQRYFSIETDEDPTALAAWFGGALAATIDGSAPHSQAETVVAASAYTFHPANAATNAGFLRDNAVLVLFLLSDSPDLSPAQVPTSDFVAMIETAKAGCRAPSCVVTAGAIAGACYENPDNTNTRLTDFLPAFGAPPAVWVDLGQGPPDFTGVLGSTLAQAISDTCEQIPPEG